MQYVGERRVIARAYKLRRLILGRISSASNLKVHFIA
jgi:hypothetical protein